MDLTSMTIAKGANGSYRVLVATNDFAPPGVTTPAERGEVYSLDDPSKPENWVATGFKAHLAEEKAKHKDDPKVSPGTRVTSISTDPNNEGVFYVGTGNHVHRCMPSGKCDLLHAGVWNDSLIYGVTFTGGTMHMATCNGIYDAPSAPDEFDRWKANGTFVTSAGHKCSNTSILAGKSPESSELVAVNGVACGNAPKGVIISSDGGASWKSVPGTENLHGDHLGGAAEFLSDGSVMVTGDTLTRVSALTSTQACGPDGPVEAGGSTIVSSTADAK
jgi:hypothetical protein